MSILKKPFFGRFKADWKWPKNINDQEKWTRIRFPSESGATLSGIYRESDESPKGVILCVHPMGKSAKGFFIRYGHADIFLKNNYNVFLFDINGFGESSTGNFNFAFDVYSAGQQVSKLWPNIPIGALGISLGAAALISACELFNDHPFNVIVVEGTFTSLEEFWKSYKLANLLLKISKRIKPSKIKQFHPIEQISNLKLVSKILLIHCKTDEICPIEMLDRLKNQVNIPAETWVLDEGTHTKAIEVNPIEYEKNIINFFRNSL